MGTHNPWIESTEEALRARMQRVGSSSGVRRSALLANHDLKDFETIILAKTPGE